eukprot:3500492-Rhodomonas_salina.3
MTLPACTPAPRDTRIRHADLRHQKIMQRRLSDTRSWPGARLSQAPHTHTSVVSTTVVVLTTAAASAAAWWHAASSRAQKQPHTTKYTPAFSHTRTQ